MPVCQQFPTSTLDFSGKGYMDSTLVSFLAQKPKSIIKIVKISHLQVVQDLLLLKILK